MALQMTAQGKPKGRMIYPGPHPILALTTTRSRDPNLVLVHLRHLSIEYHATAETTPRGIVRRLFFIARAAF
jgi:hypothetical protein